MATPAERLKNWLKDLGNEVKETIGGWLSDWLTWFGLKVLDELDKATKPLVTPLVDKSLESPNMPSEIRTILEDYKEKSLPHAVAVALPYIIGAAIGFAAGFMEPSRQWAQQQVSTIDPYQLLELRDALMGYQSGDVTREQLDEVFDKNGYHDWQWPILEKLRVPHLDPMTSIILHRRFGEKYPEILRELKEQGWTQERIDRLLDATLFYPSPSDLITWQAREVFEPDMIERYGLADEFENLDLTMFEKAGVSEEQAKNYWMAHWEHASYMQIREMIHRGVLTESREMPAVPTTKEGWEARDAEGERAAYDWYRLVEIPPFWRARLTEMMFEVPTRVDVRRWWDMRTIAEDELRSIYHRQGYHGKDLDNYVLWTKVYVAFPDLMARYRNGWITSDEVLSELTTLGMPAERAQEMLETKMKKPLAPERVEAERDLTKAEIYAGVKKGVITWDEGKEMLMALGYDEYEAQFILKTRVGAGSSPETYPEFMKWVQDWRRSQGMTYKEIPEEMKLAAERVEELKAKINEMISLKSPEAEIAPIKAELANAQYVYTEILRKFREQS